MRRAFRRAAAGAVVGTAALAAALVSAPGERARALDAWLLLLGGIAMALAAAETARAVGTLPPSRFERALTRPRRVPIRLEELSQTERLLEAAHVSELESHRRLRPVLRRIAAARLAARGLDLDRDGEAVLDPELWELVRPHRPIGDRAAAGPAPAALRQLIDALERI